MVGSRPRRWAASWPATSTGPRGASSAGDALQAQGQNRALGDGAGRVGRSCGVISLGSMTGYPQSSSEIRSGNSSAHRPCASQRIQSTTACSLTPASGCARPGGPAAPAVPSPVALAGVDVAVDLIVEDGQRAGDELGGAVGMPALPATETNPSQRSMSASWRPSPRASRSMPPAIASRPYTHGPHWPADWLGHVASDARGLGDAAGASRAGRRSPVRRAPPPRGRRPALLNARPSRVARRDPRADVAADQIGLHRRGAARRRRASRSCSDAPIGIS